MNKGWIKLHRDIQQHWIYPKDREFTDYEAWQDILLCVNHKPKKVKIKNRLLKCKRGESLRSMKNWARRWNWSKSKVYRFFDLLESDDMIETESETVTTRLSVCNYSTYQKNAKESETQLERKRNADETQADTNKNVKNEKNVKKYSYGAPQNWDEDEPIDYTSFVDAFNELYDRQLRVTDSKRENIRSRLRTFTGEEIKKAWQNRTKDQWLNSEGSKYLGDWKAAMRNDEKIDKYLNIQENHKSNGQRRNGKENRAERFFRIGKELFEDAPAGNA